MSITKKIEDVLVEMARDKVVIHWYEVLFEDAEWFPDAVGAVVKRQELSRDELVSLLVLKVVYALDYELAKD